MRILSQGSSTDMTASVSSNSKSALTSNNTQKQVTQQVNKLKVVDKPTITEATTAKASEIISKTTENKEKLQEAVDSLNEFMKEHMPTPTASKFRLHEGLDRYYVQVVDAKTEEVVKEIPPERLLNAFYEMQKLVGMIVDEKI